MAPWPDLLVGSSRGEELAPLLAAAERCLRTWEPVWTGFLDGALLEECQVRLAALGELALGAAGGYGGPERCRLVLQRTEAALPLEQLVGDFAGLEVAGNFLFDPAEPAEVRAALLGAGAGADELGDLWLRGDRGAQLIVGSALAERLDGEEGLVRSVPVRFEARALAELSLPAQRLPRSLTTVEASTRLDAVASAGFGLSRSRMAQLIRQGAMRIGWDPVLSPSRSVGVGDRLRLEGRGEVWIQEVQLTKRDRWRIRLERR
jgi:photosystem II S4 domain protein